jgi:hypothetical protein
MMTFESLAKWQRCRFQRESRALDFEPNAVERLLFDVIPFYWIDCTSHYVILKRLAITHFMLLILGLAYYCTLDRKE